MKFYTTPYHSNLIKDIDRLSVFYEGINDYYKSISSNGNNKIQDNNKKISTVFDLGCGSGVLSYFASKYSKRVLAIDNDYKSIQCAKKTFKENNIDNVNFISADASSFEFTESADLIICEMLDTALIDEEEVPVLNNVRKYLKSNGKIIPQGIINIAEPVYMEKSYTHYEDEDFHGKKPDYKVLGNPVIFSCIDFLDEIIPEFETIINFKFDKINDTTDISINGFNNNNFNNFNKSNSFNSSNNSNFKFNGIKITTFTIINENIICGPTPMLNPPILVPLSSSYNISKNCINNNFNNSTNNSINNSINNNINSNIDNENNNISSDINNTISNTNNTNNNTNGNINNKSSSEVNNYNNIFSNDNLNELILSVRLKYVMGGGVETIEADII